MQKNKSKIATRQFYFTRHFTQYWYKSRLHQYSAQESELLSVVVGEGSIRLLFVYLTFFINC